MILSRKGSLSDVEDPKEEKEKSISPLPKFARQPKLISSLNSKFTHKTSKSDKNLECLSRMSSLNRPSKKRLFESLATTMADVDGREKSEKETPRLGPRLIKVFTTEDPKKVSNAFYTPPKPTQERMDVTSLHDDILSCHQQPSYQDSFRAANLAISPSQDSANGGKIYEDSLYNRFIKDLVERPSKGFKPKFHLPLYK